MTFERRLAATLDKGLDGLSPVVCERLANARRSALATLPEGQSTTRGLGNWLSIPAMAIAASLALAIGLAWWPDPSAESVDTDVDAALLADEFPLDLYLDSGFFRYLDEQSSTEKAD